MDTKTEASAQGMATSNDAPSQYNRLGMRVWTADEMKVVRSIGERTKPFSLSAALGN